MNENKLAMKQETGITLVALIVTIVILIILATISINIVFNEDGIVNKAEKARQHQANATIDEDEMLDKVEQEYLNHIEELEEAKRYVDSQLIKAPKLSDGMIPVKWNGSNWVKTTADDSSWYNYGSKEWANIVLSDSRFNGDILDETKPYSQLVWIPRFAYKITSGWHSSTTGTIDVVFVGTDNKGKDGVVYNGTYNDAINGITSGGAMKNFVVNPAFDYGETKLEGFWIGKFESSHTGCTTDVATGQAAYTGNEVMQIKPNVTSWRNITIGDAFEACLNMNNIGNSHGLSINDNIVDPHLIKNTEWGAVAYLSKSKYGKETEEVFINNSRKFITGNAGETASATYVEEVANVYHTKEGQKASTTGNIYGVYDMNGGSWERVAAYVNNNHENGTKYGTNLVGEGTKTKYRDIYEKGASDTQELNYEKAAGKYGDAIYETSNGYASVSMGWYNDWTNFIATSYLFILRSGTYSTTTNAGLFDFATSNGNSHVNYGFRVTVSVI